MEDRKSSKAALKEEGASMNARPTPQVEPVDARAEDLQKQLNAFWSTRGEITGSTPLNVRSNRELQVWMGVLQPLLPPAPVDVVDLGTGRGFLALVFAALGHRSRGFDLAEGMLEKAREYGNSAANPPIYDFGDAIAPPLQPNSVDVVANRNVLWTLLDPELAFRNWFTVLRPSGRLICVHGVEKGGTPAEAGEAHKATYSEEINQRLIGIYREPTLDPAIPLARGAGFVDVQVQQLTAIEQFERELKQQAAGSVEKTWLVLTATRP